MAEGVRGIAVPYYVIAEWYTDHWKVLPFQLEEGMAILVFAREEKAQGFIDANWKSLGPGWEPRLLWAHQLAYVLQRYADVGGLQLVVLDYPAASVASLAGTYEVDVTELGTYVEALRERYGF